MLATTGIGLAWAGLAAAESPQLGPARFKVPPEGTRLVYENLETGERQSGVVDKSEGFIVRWTWQGQANESITHFCTDCRWAGIGPDGGPLGPLFPLEDGKGVQFKIARGRTVWLDEILVVGTDRLTTPAGTFDCYLVRRRSKSPDESWRGEQLSWYDPVLGWIVKFEASDSTGRSQRWQLVDYD